MRKLLILFIILAICCLSVIITSFFVSIRNEKNNKTTEENEIKQEYTEALVTTDCNLENFKSGKVLVNSVDRDFIVYEPTSIKANPSLLIFFHGGGGDGNFAAETSGFKKLADERGFLAIFPTGIQKQWNDDEYFDTPRSTADDFAFVDCLIKGAQEKYNSNPEKVYLSGASNGGMFIEALACTQKGRYQIAGLATVIALIPKNLNEEICLEKGISTKKFFMNGTDDPFINFYGGNSLIGDSLLSADESITIWSKINNCTGEKKETDLSNTNGDYIFTTKIEYLDCKNNDLVFYRVNKGGHNYENRDLKSTAQEIGDFFGL